MKNFLSKSLRCMLLLLIISTLWVQAQYANNTTHTTIHNVAMGPTSGFPYTPQYTENGVRTPNFHANEYIMLSQTISETNTGTMRLFFTNVFLGKHSFITITSLLDGDVQRLDNSSLEIWNYGTAFFNGDAVEVKLYIAPGDNNVKLTIAKSFAIEGNQNIAENQCGPNDDRISSTEPAAGRLMPVGCTGWITSNGRYCTAGHCMTAANPMDIMEFNVPASLSNGTTVAAAVNDQYPVVKGTEQFQAADANNNGGNDWCVYNVGVNSNTGLLPNEAQGNFNVIDQVFYRCTKDNSGATIRVTGYGIDNVPLGTSGNRNSDNQTQQTHTGPFDQELIAAADDVSVEYTVDTEGGNSGSPVILNGTRNTIGIHTNAGCNTVAPFGSNEGTGFEEDDLETALQSFLGSGQIYVDVNHPSATASGTVLRPYKTMNTAITNAAAGNVLQIVEGVYSESVVTNKNLIMRAPVGMVRIGPGITPPPIAPQPTVNATRSTPKNGAIPQTTLQVMPNPFTQTAKINVNTGDETPLTMAVYDEMGTKVMNIALNELAQNAKAQFELDATQLAAGVYFVVLQTDKAMHKTKITRIN